MKYYNIYTHVYISIMYFLEFTSVCTSYKIHFSHLASLPKKYTIAHFPGENASINVTHVLTIPITIPKINTTHAK